MSEEKFEAWLKEHADDYHRPPAGVQDRRGGRVVPVVDDDRKHVSVRSAGHTVEEAARHHAAAIGHTRGLQVVVVETGGRPVVVGGDVAVWFGELDEPKTEGQLRVRALDPELVWLTHVHEPWRPSHEA